MNVLAKVKAFLNDEEGASGIEYAMIAGMVAVVLAATAGTTKDSIKAIFTEVDRVLSTLKPTTTP